MVDCRKRNRVKLYMESGKDADQATDRNRDVETGHEVGMIVRNRNAKVKSRNSWRRIPKEAEVHRWLKGSSFLQSVLLSYTFDVS